MNTPDPWHPRARAWRRTGRTVISEPFVDALEARRRPRKRAKPAPRAPVSFADRSQPRERHDP